MKYVIKSLAKSVLIPLGLTAEASGADPVIHKKILGSGTKTLIISHDKMEGINKIVEVHLLKIIVYYQKELVKQFKTKLRNKKEDS